MPDQDDLITIQEVLAGEVKAYAVLVDKYKDMAVTLAYNILLNREDAEEVAQDAFLKVFTSLSSFKGQAKFSTWLYRIIVNTALNKRKVRKHIPLELTNVQNDNFPVNIKDTVARLVTTEHKKHIQFAMRALSDNERLCITLFYLNDLSVEEVNESTGISIANVKVLLYRARKNLYQSLHNHLKNEISDLI